MKKCTKCHEEKTIDNFSLRQNRKHYLSICKQCSAKKSNEWYWENRQRSLDHRKKYYSERREEYLRKGKEYYLKNRDEIRNKVSLRNRTPEYREKKRKQANEWNARNRKKVSERANGWKKKNPEKAIAHQYVMWAIRLNVIRKPQECEMCKREIKTEAHHDDYSKPLEVKWLCKVCHADIHWNMKETI